MLARTIRTTLRFVIRHPFISLIGVVLVLAGLSVVLGGGQETEQPANPPTAQQPGDQGPDDGTSAPQPPADDGPVSLTPAPSANEAPLVKDKRYSYVNKASDDEENLDPEPPAEQPKLQLPDDVNPYAPAPDPYDVAPSHRADATGEHVAQPALQRLPYSGKNIYADISDRSPDGRIVVAVSYRGSLKKAKAEWRRFLRRNRDPGTSYLVIFRR